MAMATRWEARCLSGSGFSIEFDQTWLDAARELKTACGVIALLGYVDRCRQRSVTRTRA